MKHPLSPHLTIYKPQWTSVLSIFHRVTGVGLGLFWIFCTYLFWDVKNNPETDFTSLFRWILGIGLFFLFYHLLNGIRHLGWDLGFGFDLKRAEKNGKLVFLLSLLLTLIFIIWRVL